MKVGSSFSFHGWSMECWCSGRSWALLPWLESVGCSSLPQICLLHARQFSPPSLDFVLNTDSKLAPCHAYVRLLRHDICRTWRVPPVVDCLCATQPSTARHDIDILSLAGPHMCLNVWCLRQSSPTMRDVYACHFWDLHHNSIGYANLQILSDEKEHASWYYLFNLYCFIDILNRYWKLL